MKRFARKLMALAAVGVAAAAAVVPAAGAQAAEAQLNCPRIYGVCGWTGPAGQGQLRLFFGPEPFVVPPLRSAQNQTGEPYCFYSEQVFRGDQRREVSPGETVHDFGFDVYSLKPGFCTY